MSQRDRVLAALHRRGRHGITQIDFDLPDVIDGGAPIKRVAARIDELRNEGFRIESGERRQKCIVYRLRPTEVTSVTAQVDEGGLSLWPAEEAKPRNAIFDSEAA